jgi:hypothetical protein
MLVLQDATFLPLNYRCAEGRRTHIHRRLEDSPRAGMHVDLLPTAWNTPFDSFDTSFSDQKPVAF